MHIIVGRSRTRPVRAEKSFDARGALTKVRLHIESSLLSRCSGDHAEELGAWLHKGSRGAPAESARLDAWIEGGMNPAGARTREARGSAAGSEHHLEELAEPLFMDTLADAFAPQEGDAIARPVLRWNPRRRTASRVGLQLGCFVPGDHLIRMHPVLDHKSVPDWMVRFVLFHELLHAVIPATVSRGGRRMHHPAAFRLRERAYPDYARAIAWERANLNALIRRARAGG